MPDQAMSDVIGDKEDSESDMYTDLNAKQRKVKKKIDIQVKGNTDYYVEINEVEDHKH